MIDETPYFIRATHIRCKECGAGIETSSLGFDITSSDDLDYAVEEDLCCMDPNYVAVIRSDEPMFPKGDPASEVNQGYHIRANPRLGILEDRWDYELEDDFFAALEDQEDGG